MGQQSMYAADGKITRLGKIAWRSLLEEIQADMIAGALIDEDIMYKFKGKFSAYSNQLIKSAVGTSRNFLDITEMVRELLTLDIYGETRDIVFGKVINRLLSIDESVDPAVIKAALQKVLPEHRELAYIEAERIANMKMDFGYLHQPAYIVAKNISTERYPKQAFGLLIRAVESRLGILESARNETLRREKEIAERKRKEEAARCLAARIAEENKKEEEETRRRKEAEEKNRKRKDRLSKILSRSRVAICRNDNKPLPPAITIESDEELALLNNGAIVFFKDEICRIEKSPSGQIKTHFLAGVRIQKVKERTVPAETKIEAGKNECAKAVNSPIKPDLVWVVFKGRTQKLPTIRHIQIRDASILMGIGAILAAENGDKHFPVYEIAKGGAVPIGTARRATKEEKRLAKGIAV